MKLPSLFLFILLVVSARGQVNPLFLEPTRKEADSLRFSLTQNINDTLRMAAFRDLSIFYLDINTDSAMYFAEQDLPLAIKLRLKLWEADAWDLIAISSSNHGNLVKALKAYTEATRIAKDPGSEKNIWRISKFTNSTQPEFARLSMLATIQSDMCSHYQATENYQQQLTCVKDAIKTASSINDFTVLSQAYRSVADIYQRDSDLDSALIFYKLSLDYANKAGYKKYSNQSYDQIGNILLKKRETQAALQSYRNALQSSRETNNRYGVGHTYVLMANYYHVAGRNDSALYFGKAGLRIVRRAGGARNAVGAYHVLVSIYKSLDNADSALAYLQLETAAKDSMLSLDKIKQLQNIGFAEQQRLLEVEAAQKELQAKLRTNILMGSTFTLVVITFFLYRNNRTKQKAKLRVEAAYDQLKATQSQLIQSEKMASLGELTAGIAHEIQNPLNFVNNFSEVNSELTEELSQAAKRGDLNEVSRLSSSIRENEEKIIHHGKRADSIVKSMLQHSRKSSGQKELTDINALCDEYLRLAYHGLRAKDKTFNAKFESNFDPSVGQINVLPQEIGRVILNLINNAFYAVTEKAKLQAASYQPQVTVATKNISGKIEIRVIDNGMGIPGSIKEKIFQPFFTTKPTGQGTGLGLSLSYDIITKGHSGELTVTTKEGSGSEFIVTLPV